MIRCPIVGTNYRPIADQVAFAKLENGDDLFLIPEPDNEHDPLAIKVLTAEAAFVGYIPRSHNRRVHDEGFSGIEAAWVRGMVNIVWPGDADHSGDLPEGEEEDEVPPEDDDPDMSERDIY